MRRHRAVTRFAPGRRTWMWPFAASVVLWLADSALAGKVSFELLFVNATLATFLALAGVAQMVVIASGGASFDLSLPYVITASAYVSTGILGGGREDVASVVLALATGVLVAVLNSLLIVVVRMPAIVATLATGYLLYTAIERLEQGGGGAASVGFGSVLRAQIDGIATVLVIGLFAGVVVAFLLNQTVYGRRLHAMGQSRPAAELAGMRLFSMTLYNFGLSGLLGALIGVLLAAYQGGAFQGMGDVYLLGSVAAVIVGGVSVGGGVSSVAAVAFAAVALTLLTTGLEITKLGPGGQDITQGVVIIGTVALPAISRRISGRARRRSTNRSTEARVLT